MLLTELFHTQSSRWSGIASGHINRIHDLICIFVEQSFAYTVKEEQVRNELWLYMRASLQKNLAAAVNELQTICEDEKMPPITYNHYYTDNIDKARQEGMKDTFWKAIDAANTDLNSEAVSQKKQSKAYRRLLKEALEKKVIVNMDQRACEEAKIALNAYYKVKSILMAVYLYFYTYLPKS